jgi:hypothetical protein
MVTGKERPLTLNAELFVSAAVTVTSAPLALKLPEALPLVPTTTLPSPKLVGETESWPAELAPDPVSDTPSVGFEASVLNVATAEKLPAALGVN